jgi:hypothetical protein
MFYEILQPNNGDVDIKVDSWSSNGVVKSALKYVAYAKKK